MRPFAPIVRANTMHPELARLLETGLGLAVRTPIFLALFWGFYEAKCALGIDLIPGLHLSDIIGF